MFDLEVEDQIINDCHCDPVSKVNSSIEELCFVINMNKEYHHHWDHPTKQGEDLKQVLQLQLLQPQLKKDTMCKTFNLITLILQLHGCLQLREDSKKDIWDDGDGKNNGDE